MTGRIYTGLNDPRADRNARLQTAGLDLGAGFERDDKGRLQLRVSDPLIQSADGRYTVSTAPTQTAAQAVGSVVTVGPDFPADPDVGHVHVSTSLGYDVFVWNGTQSKWLTVRTDPVAFTNQTTVAVGGFLRLYQSPFTTSALGYRLKWNATLVEATAWKDNVLTAPSIDVYSGASLKYQHTIAAGDNESKATDLAVDFDESANINVKISANALTSGGGIALTFRRRP